MSGKNYPDKIFTLKTSFFVSSYPDVNFIKQYGWKLR